MTIPPSRQASQELSEELQERRACAKVEVGKHHERNSSLQLVGVRLAAVVRAWEARDDKLVRDALSELAEEALLLARSDPLWPERPGRGDTGWAT